MKKRAVLGATGFAGGVVILGQLVAVNGSSAQESAQESIATDAGPSFSDVDPDVFVGSDAVGPDVIVGSVGSVLQWASNGTETAYSIATTSCNIGTEPLDWIDAPSNLHPVIAQSMYRLLDGRFEQIGQSWLKHGFCAIQQNLGGCGTCSNQPGCLDQLNPGCADPYDAGTNGNQNRLGPKWQVNPVTGVFAMPWAAGEGTGGSYNRRLRVKNTDLANPGALYFLEGHYITQDDAQAGNGNNNASYTRIEIDPGTYQATVVSFTAQRASGI